MTRTIPSKLLGLLPYADVKDYWAVDIRCGFTLKGFSIRLDPGAMKHNSIKDGGPQCCGVPRLPSNYIQSDLFAPIEIE